MLLYLQRVAAVAAALSLAIVLAGRYGSPALMQEPLVFYLGTYNGGSGPGIYRVQISPSGADVETRAVAETPNPSFLEFHPSGRWLFAVNEIDDYKGFEQGSITTFRLSSEGDLDFTGRMGSGGADPCHLFFAAGESALLVANYSGGSVAALSFREGKLTEPRVVQHLGSSVDPRRQSSPHAHCVRVNPVTGIVAVADLGLDQIKRYRLENLSLLPASPPVLGLTPGSGPRHFRFDQSGQRLYVINELNSTITFFRVSGEGEFEPAQVVSTLPRDWKGDNYPAEVALHPSERYLYASNRGHDSIAVFSIDPMSGQLQPIQHADSGGRGPRHFALTAAGDYLVAANQTSDNVVLFRVSAQTGRLTPLETRISIESPVCVAFPPPEN